MGNYFDQQKYMNTKMTMVTLVSIVTIVASYFLLQHQKLTEVIAVVATVSIFIYIMYLATNFSQTEKKRFVWCGDFNAIGYCLLEFLLSTTNFNGNVC